MCERVRSVVRRSARKPRDEARSDGVEGGAVRFGEEEEVLCVYYSATGTRQSFDVLVQESLVEIASNCVVDETLTDLGFVASLISEDDVVVPSTLGSEISSSSSAAAAQVEQRVTGG